MLGRQLVVCGWLSAELWLGLARAADVLLGRHVPQTEQHQQRDADRDAARRPSQGFEAGCPVRGRLLAQRPHGREVLDGLPVSRREVVPEVADAAVPHVDDVLGEGRRT